MTVLLPPNPAQPYVHVGIGAKKTQAPRGGDSAAGRALLINGSPPRLLQMQE